MPLPGGSLAGTELTWPPRSTSSLVDGRRTSRHLPLPMPRGCHARQGTISGVLSVRRRSDERAAPPQRSTPTGTSETGRAWAWRARSGTAGWRLRDRSTVDGSAVGRGRVGRGECGAEAVLFTFVIPSMGPVDQRHGQGPVEASRAVG